MIAPALAPLQIEEVQLMPGEEWQLAGGAWCFVRLKRGAVYWLSAGPNFALSVNDTLITTPPALGVLRASQIGEVTLQVFSFVPGLIWGFFTLAERKFFDSFDSRDRKDQVRFLRADDPFAQRYAAMIDERATRPPLLQRMLLLALIFETFSDSLAKFYPPSRGASAKERFAQLICRLPDSDLANHGPEDLARMCGCSARHFNRLFREEFGDSVRSRQTIVRLTKAKSLLSLSDQKIIDIAQSCGYRNLSLFNSLFKKNFKMTPSEWRRKTAKKIAGISVCFLLAAAAHDLCAQTNTPAASAKSPSQTFDVKGYQLTGDTLLGTNVTNPIFEKHIGKINFEGIREALAELQGAYRERGFITVAVALPQQQITNGIVKVQVTEGRLAEVRVIGNRYFSSNNVMRDFPGLRTNALLNSLVFQQELDRANANRDRQIYPLMSPGAEPGTTDLELKVKDRLPLHAHVEVNNNYTPFTPELRVDTAAQYNNLWQLNHQLGVQYSFTPQQLKEGSAPFYEKPLIASYSAFYRAPLFGATSQTQPSDQPLSNFGYDEATKRFRPPPASQVTELLIYASRSSSDTGSRLTTRNVTPEVLPPAGGLQVADDLFTQTLNPNEDVGLRFLRPLPDFAGIESSMSLGFDYKNYQAEVVQTKVLQGSVFTPEFGQAGPPFIQNAADPIFTSQHISAQAQYIPISLAWNASRKDKQGATLFDLGFTFQPANFLSSESEFEAAALDRKADGRFYVVTAGITREQNIWRDWGIKFHADGQWANEPLISTEQFALGGLAGVRGYHEGELYGDRGWRVLIEPHSPYLNLGTIDNKLPVLVRLYTFFDVGERFLIGNGLSLDPVPTIQEKDTFLMGAGFGFSGTAGEHMDFRVQIGVAILNTPRLPPFGERSVSAGDSHLAFAFGFNF